MFAGLVHVRIERAMALFVLAMLSCASGCGYFRTQLISEEKEFRELCGRQDELRYDSPLFKKNDGTGKWTFYPEDANDRNNIAIVPKGTKVTIVDVYRWESCCLTGKVTMRKEYPTLAFTADGRTYQNVEAGFDMLERNRNAGSARIIGPFLSPPNNR